MGRHDDSPSAQGARRSGRVRPVWFNGGDIGIPQVAAPGSERAQAVGTMYAAAMASRKGCQSAAETKCEAGSSHSLPVSAYSRLRGLPQGPGRAAESSGRPRTDEDMGHDVRLLWAYRGGGDVGPLVGPAVGLRALGGRARVRAARPGGAPADSSAGRQRE